MIAFNTWFPTSRYGNDVLNVRDFGAVGDGVADDTAEIQACFDAAFGSRTSPNGNTNRHLNKSVYFPSGNYRITAPLYLTGVKGGRIFGNGVNCTEIGYEFANAGNAWISSGAGSEVSPAIMMNGCAYTVMEDILLGGDAVSNASNVGIYVYGGIPELPTTMTQFRNMIITGFGQGMLVGYGGTSAQCDNGSLFNVNFVNCGIAGIKCVHQNAINWHVYGGGGANCCMNTTYDPGVDLGNAGAVYSSIGGSICFIAGVSMSGNNWDFLFASSSPCVILGGSSESPGGPEGREGGSIVNVNSSVLVSGFAYRNEFADNCCFIEGTYGGFTHCTGCIFNPPNPGVGRIAQLGNNGQIILENLETGSGSVNCVITGGSNSKVWARGVHAWPTGMNIFNGFGGKVLEYTPVTGTTLATMPAAACFAGLTRVITDLTSNTAGASAAGGGALKGFCWCDGVNWKVIGPVS